MLKIIYDKCQAMMFLTTALIIIKKKIYANCKDLDDRQFCLSLMEASAEGF